MNASRDRRLARLEQAKREQARLEQDRRPAAAILYVWRDAGIESAKKAIARRCPQGVPPGARLVICSWQAEDELTQRARG
jgi:hypothetical protein